MPLLNDTAHKIIMKIKGLGHDLGTKVKKFLVQTQLETFRCKGTGISIEIELCFYLLQNFKISFHVPNLIDKKFFDGVRTMCHHLWE